jgi:hypothetical protein
MSDAPMTEAVEAGDTFAGAVADYSADKQAFSCALG